MHTKLHTEESLRTASDVFVTFLYAASVHLIIAHFAQPEPMTAQTGFVVLCIILFLFSDWLSRVRLPWLLPPDEEVGVGSQLAKAVLEVSGLFFLVVGGLATVAAVKGHNIEATLDLNWGALWAAELNPYKPFAIFLFATFLWNLFMLLVMRDLRWGDLVKMGISGNALDSPTIERYAKRFWQFRKELDRRAEARVKTGIQNIFHDLGVALSNLWQALPIMLEESFARTGAQIVAFHIAWTNLIAATIILIEDMFFERKPLLDLATQLHSVTSSSVAKSALVACAFLISVFTVKEWKRGRRIRFFYLSLLGLLALAFLFQTMFVVVAIVAVPTAVFVLASGCNEAGQWRKGFLYSAGLLGTAMILFLYVTFETRTLLVIVAAQQVLVNIFLQYAASEQSITVNLSPLSVTLEVEQQVQFSAIVRRTTNTDVIWEATSGSITPMGLFKAPATAAAVTVRAVLEADQSRFAEATVTVIGLS